ncbi:MAG: SIMPL domain-containing protein [Bacteroidales bacterium]|nr:SIMPL domain-containing protein [Candidatus Liminaster caballi]
MKNSIVLAIGIALAGFFIYCGIDNFASKDRYVTVRGLSECEVMADQVTWDISFNVTGNQLEALYPRLQPKQDQLLSFLKDNGVTDDEIFFSAPTCYDRSDWYNWNEKKAYTDQFVVTGSLTIVSEDVEKIRNIHMQQLELMKRGVVIDGSRPSYNYMGLNELKPVMVEEATRNARIVANKFAEDADCSIGSIRNARQGQFEVYSDEIRPYMRHVRVVTTIDYFLK